MEVRKGEERSGSYVVNRLRMHKENPSVQYPILVMWCQAKYDLLSWTCISCLGSQLQFRLVHLITNWEFTIYQDCIIFSYCHVLMFLTGNCDPISSPEHIIQIGSSIETWYDIAFNFITWFSRLILIVSFS